MLTPSGQAGGLITCEDADHDLTWQGAGAGTVEESGELTYRLTRDMTYRDCEVDVEVQLLSGHSMDDLKPVALADVDAVCDGKQCGARTIPVDTAGITVLVDLVDDTLYEESEWFHLIACIGPCSDKGDAAFQDTEIIDEVGAFSFQDAPCNSCTITTDEFVTETPIRIERTGDAPGSITLDAYSSSACGIPVAQAGVDYEGGTFVIDFAGGDAMETYFLRIYDDDEDEPNEFACLDLGSATGDGASIDIGEASLRIRDDDAPGSTGGGTTTTTTSTTASSTQGSAVFKFSSETYSVQESQGAVTITVVRTVQTTGVGSVKVTASLGTAQPEDFSTLSHTLDFPAGVASRSVSVPFPDDVVIDGDKTVLLTLSDVVGGSLGTPSSAVLTIIDDDTDDTDTTSSSGGLGAEGNKTEPAPALLLVAAALVAAVAYKRRY